MRLLLLLILGYGVLVTETLFSGSWDWNGARPSLIPWVLACAAVVPSNRSAAAHLIFAAAVGIALDGIHEGMAGPRTIACVAATWVMVHLRRGDGEPVAGGVVVALFMTAIVLQVADSAAMTLAGGTAPARDVLFGAAVANAACSACAGLVVWQLGRLGTVFATPLESPAR